MLGAAGESSDGASDMRTATFPGLLALVLAAMPALADRPVTDEERAKLVAAMQAQGCSGGSMEHDDNRYEVDDARCADGKTYDLKFDASFKLIEKDLDD
jgi:Peptidase propeptide and YPEB domain